MDEDLQKVLKILYSEPARRIDWLRLHVSLSGVELEPPVRRGFDVLLDNRMTLWAEGDGTYAKKLGLYREDTPVAWRGALEDLLEKGRPSWEELLTELGEWADGL